MAGFELNPKKFKEMQIESVLHSSARLLAGDDVAKIGDGEDVLLHGTRFSLGKAFNAVWSEDEVEVEGAVFELDEVLTSNDFGLGVVVESKAQSEQGFNHALAVLFRLSWKNIHVLRGARITEEDGGALADEQVVNALFVECPGDFLRLERIEWEAVVHSDGEGWKPR